MKNRLLHLADSNFRNNDSPNHNSQDLCQLSNYLYTEHGDIRQPFYDSIPPLRDSDTQRPAEASTHPDGNPAYEVVSTNPNGVSTDGVEVSTNTAYGVSDDGVAVSTNAAHGVGSAVPTTSGTAALNEYDYILTDKLTA